MFIGYPFGMKAYKVLDLESNKVVVPRDAVFHEIVFPLASKVFSNDIVEMFPNVVFPLPVFDSIAEMPIQVYAPAHSPRTDKSVSLDESFPISSNHSAIFSEVHTRSKRVIKKPHYLQAYHCSSLSYTAYVSSTSHPISNVLSYDKLKGNFKVVVISISSLHEPTMFP